MNISVGSKIILHLVKLWHHKTHSFLCWFLLSLPPNLSNCSFNPLKRTLITWPSLSLAVVLHLSLSLSPSLCPSMETLAPSPTFIPTSFAEQYKHRLNENTTDSLHPLPSAFSAPHLQFLHNLHTPPFLLPRALHPSLPRLLQLSGGFIIKDSCQRLGSFSKSFCQTHRVS